MSLGRESLPTQPPAFEFFNLHRSRRPIAWAKWIKSIENFIIAAGVTSPTQKFGILMYVGGSEMQEEYEFKIKSKMSYDIENDVYEAAVRHFTEYFDPTPAVGVREKEKGDP